MSNNEEDRLLIQLIQHSLHEGPIQQKAQSFLNQLSEEMRITLNDGSKIDTLEIGCSVLPNTLQDIFNEYKDLCDYDLNPPAPKFLSIKVFHVLDTQSASYIIPSEKLDIGSLISERVSYKLAAVICRLNNIDFLYLRDFADNQWYYHQSFFPCKKISEESNKSVNSLITSTRYNDKSINELHFTISPFFYNAVKYIYERFED